MKLDTTPVLDARDASDIFSELVALQPAWTPELMPAIGEPGWALFQIFARYMQTSIERLNKAPANNLLAFLDTFGIPLIPPQPARAPVVFTPVPNSADAHIPAQTRLSANVPGTPSPVIFETEQDGAMAAAKLTDIVALWPTQDSYADHSSDAAGKRPFTLFDSLDPVDHSVYIAHDTVFAFSGSASVDIEFELTVNSNSPISTRWHFWDGQVWRPFTDIDPSDPTTGSDGTVGFTRSGILSLRAGCGASQPTTVNGIQSHWIRGQADGPFPPDTSRALPTIQRIRVRSSIGAGGASPSPPDAAFADSTKLDVSKAFYPFGQQPRTGSTFYISAAAAFAKPGAQVTLTANYVDTAISQNNSVSSSPRLAFEYWNGRAWTDTGVSSSLNFFGPSGSQFSISFTIAPDIAAVTVNSQQAVWLRIRIQSGNFVNVNKVSFTTGTAPATTASVTIVTVVPPVLEQLQVSYTYRSPWTFPDQCLTYNDFQWQMHTHDVRWPGNPFAIFNPVADATPTVYFGFDRPLPNDYVSIYFDIAEANTEGPTLVWEAWDGAEWTELTVDDETGQFSRQGMVSFVPPIVQARAQAAITAASGTQVTVASALDAALFTAGDQVLVQQTPNSELSQVASISGANITLTIPLVNTYTVGTISLSALARFGVSRDWVRARLKENGDPADAEMNAVYLNALWAVQRQTITGEILGGGQGIVNQSFFLNNIPVLPGEQLEIRELDGLLADVEYPILQAELTAEGYTSDDIDITIDPRSGKVTEVWVVWQEQPNFYFSGPDDRHYLIDRSSGRILFGDGVHGKLPPVGLGNIRARQYQAGGGVIGNVPVGAIKQIMSGILASGVSNPRAGEAGADGETLDGIASRGPNDFRHRWRSLSANDYESLAREASPSVAAVRALPATSSNGRPMPGAVTVIIVPKSQDPQPQPSFDLRQEVQQYLALRAPATVSASNVAVIGPTYLPVGVSAIVVPKDPTTARTLEQAALSALAAFLHPLTGGPDGDGWDFGRSVYLSDVAALLQTLPGVDHTEYLELLLNDTPVGASVSVPPERMVVAGSLIVEAQIS